jgi:alpha/beta superfamily hydrolase
MADELHVVQVTIPGHCGHLEGRLLYREETANEIGAILCPPHPLLAGNMDNNVIQAVAKQVAEIMPVLLFNYPAVGKSTSPRPNLPLFEVWNALDQSKEYSGIAEDVRRVIAWSGSYFRRYHLIGYSFGACMALTALTTEAISYTAIAPPLAEEDFSALPTLPLPVCLITAEQESLLAAPDLLFNQPHISHASIEGADHFFRNHEVAIARRVLKFCTGSQVVQISIRDTSERIVKHSS